MTIQLGISQYTSHVLNLVLWHSYGISFCIHVRSLSPLFPLVCCCLSVSLYLSFAPPLSWLWARGDRFRGGTGSIFSTWTNDTETQAWTTPLLQRHFNGKTDSWLGPSARLQSGTWKLNSDLNQTVFLRQFCVFL